MKGASGIGVEPKCCFESRGPNLGGDSPHRFTVFTKAMKDFFVSYNRADKQWAMWITQTLEQAGYTATAQYKDFRPGNNFVLEMQQAAVECNRTIAVLSESYLKSTFTQPEWAAAFAQDPQGKQRKLIPVRVKKCDLEGLLPQIIYIDLVGLDKIQAKQELLDGILDEPPNSIIDFPGQPSVRSTSETESEPLPELPQALSEVQKIKEAQLKQQWDSLRTRAEDIIKDINCGTSYTQKGILQKQLDYVYEEMERIETDINEIGL